MQTFGEFVDGYYDVADQLTHDLQRRAHEHFRRQEQEKAQLATLEAFEAHRQQMRHNFLEAIGGLPGPLAPAERTPLNARVTGTVERDGYTIEKVLYESLPNFFVTAACYVPHDIQGKAPVVVMVHGHALEAKGAPVYQKVAIDLVTNGFIVLAIDPPGQGERWQYVENGEWNVTPCTIEHTHAGIQYFAQGKCITRQFLWDNMRGIDYLATRGDVDMERIGVTGSSGGGTQSCHLMMLEPRVAAAVPCTFVMTLESYMKTGQSQDGEQILHGCMAIGPDHDDFLTAMAPKPVLVGAVAADFFPIEGALEAVRRAREIYALYDKPDNVEITVGPGTHNYSPHLRQAAVNWFKQHLKGEAPDFVTGDPEPLPDKALWVTSRGQVLEEFPDSKSIADLIREGMPAPAPSANPAELRTTLHKALHIEQAGDRSAPIYPRIIHSEIVDGYRTEKIFFFSAPDITVTGVMVQPRSAQADTPRPTTLLLLENGTNDIPTQRWRLEALMRENHNVFVFDVRGVGAVQSRQINMYASTYPIFNTEFRLNCDAIMLGLNIVGLRVFDILRGYDYLKSRADVSTIDVYGIGNSAIWAYFAAALEEGFAGLTCEDMLYSYRNLCETRYYDRDLFNLTAIPWGILQSGDLADFLPCIKPRPTTFIRLRNAYGEPVDEGCFVTG